MGTKRKGKPATAKQNRSPNVTLFTRVDPILGETFKRHVRGIRPKTTDTAVIELLIEKYLTELGLWPPADGQDAPSSD